MFYVMVFWGIPNSYEVSMPEEYGLLVLLVWHIKCVVVRYLESSSKGAGRGIKPNKIKNHIFSKKKSRSKKKSGLKYTFEVLSSSKVEKRLF